jgi:hypothetical protein
VLEGTSPGAEPDQAAGVAIRIDGGRNGRPEHDWAGHESAVAHAPLPAGRHQLRVQYYQADGWTELRVELLRGRISSTGSPGPH